MLGRCLVHFSATEFADLCRGAKLVIYENQMWSIHEPCPVPKAVDLFGLRVVHVQTDHVTDTINVTFSGPGLPEWTPGCVPATCQKGLSRWAEESPPFRSRRAFDMEDE